MANVKKIKNTIDDYCYDCPGYPGCEETCALSPAFDRGIIARILRAASDRAMRIREAILEAKARHDVQ
jgi:hypothetical protein